MTFTATYKDVSGVIIEDDVSKYNVKEAVTEAKRIAKENRWTLVKVVPKVYRPIPQVSCNCNGRYVDSYREPLELR